MTHDLIENVISGFQANLEKIVVTELRDRTFYAKLIIRRHGQSVEIDSRPSDAIALAVQMRVPIYVDEQVLEDVTPPISFGQGEPGPGEEGDPDEPEEI